MNSLRAFVRRFATASPAAPSARALVVRRPASARAPFPEHVTALSRLATAPHLTTHKSGPLDAAVRAAPRGDRSALELALRAGVVSAALEPSPSTALLISEALLEGAAPGEATRARIDDALALLGNRDFRLPPCASAFCALMSAARACGADAETAAAARRISTVARVRGVPAAGKLATLGVRVAAGAGDWALALRLLRDAMDVAGGTGGSSGAGGTRSVRRSAFALLSALSASVKKEGSAKMSPEQLKWVQETLPVIAMDGATAAEGKTVAAMVEAVKKIKASVVTTKPDGDAKPSAA